MGRTNYILLGFGLITFLAMSMMMQHTLKLKQTNDVPPIVSEITKSYGSRLVDTSEFRRRTVASGKKVGVLTIHPLLGINEKRLVQNCGHYVWRRLGTDRQLDALVVECDSGAGEPKRYQVRSPLTSGRTVALLQPGEEPSFDAVPRPVPSGSAIERPSVPTSTVKPPGAQPAPNSKR